MSQILDFLQFFFSPVLHHFSLLGDIGSYIQLSQSL
uniref:Uncharacterized protein n=1 Tax=Rhizophora mucronata TaxID=61149 RepID=A0A2P2IQH6_RHIMU